MNPMTSVTIETPYGFKSISAHCCDICELDEPLDVMTISAFYGSYAPTPHTLIRALASQGISVEQLAQHPAIDLRDLCHIWLSDKIAHARLPIGRIGCIEMTPYSPYSRSQSTWRLVEERILGSIHAYFALLDLACASGMHIETLGLPILGGGNQQVSLELVSIPMINECVSYLQRSECIKAIHIITRNAAQAYEFAKRLDGSYTIARQLGAQRLQPSVTSVNSAANPLDDRQLDSTSAPASGIPLVFLSYSSSDKNVADNLCAKLEGKGMRVWYAPRDVATSDYASSIVSAIERCTHFVVILSRNSLRSEHVLNEIDLAFQRLGKGATFAPLKIDEEELGPAFRYYLSRQHWMDAHVPPLERRLDEFVERLTSDSTGIL